jgi:hypothetical protein
MMPGLPRIGRLTNMPLFHSDPSECLQHSLTHVAMPASGAVTTGCLLTVYGRVNFLVCRRLV